MAPPREGVQQEEPSQEVERLLERGEEDIQETGGQEGTAVLGREEEDFWKEVPKFRLK